MTEVTWHVPTEFSNLKQQTLLRFSFHGPGIGGQLSWVVLVQGLVEL